MKTALPSRNQSDEPAAHAVQKSRLTPPLKL